MLSFTVSSSDLVSMILPVMAPLLHLGCILYHECLFNQQ